MDRLLQSAAHRFAQLNSEQRWQVSALFWLSVGFVVHYLFFCIPQPFVIEAFWYFLCLCRLSMKESLW